MSDLVIRDGTGTGNRAKVDIRNRLEVDASSSERITFISAVDSLAFAVAAVEFVVSTSDSNVIYFQNNDPGKTFHINKLYIAWNGGNTTGTKIMTVRLHFAPPGISLTAPTANFTSQPPLNLNFGAPQTALATNQIWNGVGAGMTVASNGVVGLSGFFSPGLTEVTFAGVILGLSQPLLISVLGGEVGVSSVTMSGWFDRETGE